MRAKIAQFATFGGYETEYIGTWPGVGPTKKSLRFPPNIAVARYVGLAGVR